MTWQNVTVDHRLPVRAFNLRKREERAIASRWTNLTAMSFESNRRKNGRYSEVELRCYKRIWRMQYAPKLRQVPLLTDMPSENPTAHSDQG